MNDKLSVGDYVEIKQEYRRIEKLKGSGTKVISITLQS